MEILHKNLAINHISNIIKNISQNEGYGGRFKSSLLLIIFFGL